MKQVSYIGFVRSCLRSLGYNENRMEIEITKREADLVIDGLTVQIEDIVFAVFGADDDELKKNLRAEIEKHFPKIA
jgi:predicted ThiF/HesA family dinucleotide-utilizing enzyme